MKNRPPTNRPNPSPLPCRCTRWKCRCPRARERSTGPRPGPSGRSEMCLAARALRAKAKKKRGRDTEQPRHGGEKEKRQNNGEEAYHTVDEYGVAKPKKKKKNRQNKSTSAPARRRGDYLQARMPSWRCLKKIAYASNQFRNLEKHVQQGIQSIGNEPQRLLARSPQSYPTLPNPPLTLHNNHTHDERTHQGRRPPAATTDTTPHQQPRPTSKKSRALILPRHTINTTPPPHQRASTATPAPKRS